MSNLSTLPKGDSAWLLRKAIERIMQQVSVLETNIGSSTTGNSSNTQVIFNDNGTLRGDTGLTYNAATDTLTAGSATITGDLTVDTNTLYVNSSLNRVGIGTASPATILDIQSAGSVFARIQNTASSADAYLLVKNGTGEGFFGINATGPYIYTAGSLPITFTTATSERYRIASDGVATWSNVGGVAGTAMTLNSTGLGIGVTPGSAIGNLQVGGSTNANLYTQQGTDTIRIGVRASGRTGIILDSSNATYTNRAWYLDNAGSSGSLTIGRQGLDVITFDNVGNVGIGVTPSAWDGNFKALQLGYPNFICGNNGGSTVDVGVNAYYNPNWKYALNSTAASRYRQSSGLHIWYNAPNSGASGADTLITWTQTMTLDASGNLFLGKTSSSSASTGCELQTGTGGNAASVFTADAAIASIMNRLTSDGSIIDFRRQTLSVGNIAVTTLATTYNSISDYRLKEAVQPLVGGLARVSALKPSIYKWKVNGSDGEGFLAHELASVVSSAVTGEKDAVNEDGSINAQSIDMSRIVPILVAAIQELTARVQTLEAR